MSFQGKWQHVKDDNIEGFLEAVGASEEGRKIVREIHPELEYGRDGDYYTVRINMPGVSEVTVKFKEGEEFDQPSSVVDPSKTRRATATKVGDGKFVIKTSPGEKLDLTETREVTGDEMVTTLEVGSTVTKRYFKRL